MKKAILMMLSLLAIALLVMGCAPRESSPDEEAALAGEAVRTLGAPYYTKAEVDRLINDRLNSQERGCNIISLKDPRNINNSIQIKDVCTARGMICKDVFLSIRTNYYSPERTLQLADLSYYWGGMSCNDEIKEGYYGGSYQQGNVNIGAEPMYGETFIEYGQNAVLCCK